MVYVQLKSLIAAKPLLKVTIERRGLEAKQKSGESLSYVQTSMDYNDFHFLAFNRDIDQKHAEEIGKSIDEFGIIGFVIVAYTDCVDGSLKKWIVDGQHTFTAEVKRKLPILYVLVRVDSLEELVRLVAVLNNKRRLWKLKDYLKAWAMVNIPIYKRITDWVAKKMPFTVILQALSNNKNRKDVTDIFKDGNFREDIKVDGEKMLENLAKLKTVLPQSRTIFAVLLRFMWSVADYDNERMFRALKAAKDNSEILFVTGDKEQDIYNKINEHYEKTI